MENKYPIFVISKGRYELKYARTVKLLKIYNVKFSLVVEPQELEHYVKLHDSFFLYPPTGVAKARQFVLEKARELGVEAFWTLDDDIQSFRHNYAPTSPQEVLVSLEHRLDAEPNIGLISPQYQQAIWRQTTSDVVNNQCVTTCILTRTAVKANYDLDLDMFEDLDFMFQVIRDGYDGILDNHWGFNAQKALGFPGKVGGIDYQPNTYTDAAAIMERKYPGIIKLNHDGTIRRNWRRARRMLRESNVRS